MAIRVAINGFGRIGRNVLRAIIESGRTDIEVVAISTVPLAVPEFIVTRGPPRLWANPRVGTLPTISARADNLLRR